MHAPRGRIHSTKTFIMKTGQIYSKKVLPTKFFFENKICWRNSDGNHSISAV